MLRPIFAAAGLVALSACATVPSERTAVSAERAVPTPHEQLHALFAESDEANL